MASTTKSRRTCTNGHTYYKSSECPVCPVCATESKPVSGFLADLAAPARRALTNNGITTLAKLAKRSEEEILDLHGMGPGSITKLKKALQSTGRSFDAGPNQRSNGHKMHK